MTNTEDESIIAQYKEVFGLTDDDLIEGGRVSEREVVLSAWRDYQADRVSAFPIEASRAALLVIDMQLGFVSRESPQWIPQAERIIPRTAAFAETARRLGVPVIFTSAQFLDPSPTDAHRMSLNLANGNLASDSRSLELADGLWQDGDILIAGKHTYDAFFETDLNYRLKGLGRDTLIIAGTLTNVCCEATARAGFDRGYHVLLASDLCATDNPVVQVATLQGIRRSYGRVLRSDQIEAELGAGRDA